jgi:hypothetical protein
VRGESSQFNGVLGISTANGHSGVAGVCDISNGNGVYGRSMQANGVIGFSSSEGSAGVAGANDDGNGNGVYGRSKRSDGVLGITSGDGKAGVAGVNDDGNGNGVYGRSARSDGVAGVTTGNGKAGVAGVCDIGNGNGVYGRSQAGNGVAGFSSSVEHAGVAGTNDNSAGVGIYGKGGRLAAFLEGDVEVTGDIRLTNADCAEIFDIAGVEVVDPGSVMVLDDEGTLRQSSRPYDKRVAGVISGGGHYKPGIVLDAGLSRGTRQPVALLGKVYCKADARFGPIDVGDLLTTSPTPGHAMKADDPAQAFGAVIGKALRPLTEGQGLVPILIALQ